MERSFRGWLFFSNTAKIMKKRSDEPEKNECERLTDCRQAEVANIVVNLSSFTRAACHQISHRHWAITMCRNHKPVFRSRQSDMANLLHFTSKVEVSFTPTIWCDCTNNKFAKKSYYKIRNLRFSLEFRALVAFQRLHSKMSNIKYYQFFLNFNCSAYYE